MNLLIHPEADQEVDAAAIWYDGRTSGLGSEFLAAVDAVYDRMIAEPAFFPPAEDTPAGREIRAAILHRFSYRVVYLVRGDDLIIVALAHVRRRPGYWHRRLTT